MFKKIALAIAILALSTQSSIPSFSNESITYGDSQLTRSIEHIVHQVADHKTK
jgi:hypothetical protein